MPSIFEKPSLLGFRAEGGRVQIPRNQYSSIPAQDAGRYTQAAGEDWVDIAGDDPRYAALLRAAESGDITGMFNPTQWTTLVQCWIHAWVSSRVRLPWRTDKGGSGGYGEIGAAWAY